ARRKFLGTPAGELRASIRMLECYALAYPEVAFRLVIDARERFAWAASGSSLTLEGEPPAPGSDAERAAERAREAAERREGAGGLWGARHAGQLIEAHGEREGMRLDALLGLPEHGRATREGQVLLVNRRWIQSPMLGQALRQAYGNLLPAGRFPAGTLWI